MSGGCGGMLVNSNLERDIARVGHYLLQRTVRRCIEDHISSDLVEEHRRSPIMWHSLALDVVLNALRLAGGELAPRYIVTYDDSRRQFRPAVVQADSSHLKIEPIGDQFFDTVEEVEHVVFRRRLKDLGFESESLRGELE